MADSQNDRSISERAWSRYGRNIGHLRRMAGKRVRATPDFFVVGTQRGGTTSLFNALSEHESVRPSTRKEIHYFDRFWHLGWKWYIAHFPEDETGRRWLTGEATADYLFASEAPTRAAATVPNARVIALLRNPVDRAYSAWKLMIRNGRESRAFEQAIIFSTGGLARRMPLAYLARGRYAEQLDRWLGSYRSERLLVVFSEDLFAGGKGLHELSEFLSIKDIESIPHSHASSGGDLGASLRGRLESYFDSSNEDLERIVGRTLPWS